MTYKMIGCFMAASSLCVLPTDAAADPQDIAVEARGLVGDLHTAFGKHHARAVHAKGIILEGRFEPTAAARDLSRAPLFNSATPIVVRFSNFTGFPDIPDDNPSANPRGMAIRFGPATAPMLDVVTHNFDGFPTKTAAEFGSLLRAIGGSGPGIAAPTPLDTFLAGHPVAKAFLTTQHPAPISYATTAYFGVNAVTFTDRKGHSRAVRYRFVPSAGEQYFGPGPHPDLNANYLQPELAKRLAAGPIRFDWYAQLGEPGDLLDDPSIAWPASRSLIKLGTLTIDRLASNSEASDRALQYEPGRMPDGIAPADPMLAIRAAAYPVSVRERQ
jgi:catalase